MKKSAIALALMGAFSGAAFAQSNVTMYGIVDVNYMWQQLPTVIGSGTTARVSQESFSAINSGHQSGSRLGVRGTEALGNGLNAVFDLEMGFDVTTGQSAQALSSTSSRLFGRQAYGGLGGSWGTVVLGRIASFSSGTGDFDMIGRVDPFGTGFGLANAGNTFISMNALRIDNAVAYVSPTMGGFKAGLGYSTNIAGTESSVPNTNVTATVAGANWTYGPFFAAITYDVVNNVGSNPNQTHLQIGGTFDIASFRLHAGWAQQSNIFAIGTASNTFITLPAGFQNYDNNAYLLGLTWNFTQGGALLASYQSSAAKSQTRNGINFDPDYNIWSIGATYNLSRRTNLYTSYASRNANGTLLDNNFNGKQFAVGVRHLF